MAAIRPAQRYEPSEAAIRIGEGPSSTATHAQFAGLANWLRGSGAQIVAGNAPLTTIGSGVTRVFRYRTKPRDSAIQRVWHILLRANSTSGVVTAAIRSPAATGTSVTVLVPAGRDLRVPVTYVQSLAAKSSTEAQVDFDLTTVGGTVDVEGVSCYEQDRPVLNKDSTDLGTDTETLRAGQPIRGVNNESIEGIHDVAIGGHDARRVGIFHWGVPEEDAVTRTTASYQTLLDLAVPVLAPMLTSGAVTGQVYWSVYAKVAAGAGGLVRLTTDGSGVSDAVTVSGTSFAWTTARAISIDCDDMTKADGRQGTRFDGLQVEYQGDGTNLLSLAGVSVWVASVA
jgi:hypothetical protein